MHTPCPDQLYQYKQQQPCVIILVNIPKEIIFNFSSTFQITHTILNQKHLEQKP